MRVGAGALWVQMEREREIHERVGNWRDLEGLGSRAQEIFALEAK